MFDSTKVLELQLRSEFHFSEIYRNVNYTGPCPKSMKGFMQTLLVTQWIHWIQHSINMRKWFQSKPWRKVLIISTKIEAIKHQLPVEQRKWRDDVADVQSDCRGPWFYLTSFKVIRRCVAQCNCWNVICSTFRWAFQKIHQECKYYIIDFHGVSQLCDVNGSALCAKTNRKTDS